MKCLGCKQVTAKLGCRLDFASAILIYLIVDPSELKFDRTLLLIFCFLWQLEVVESVELLTFRVRLVVFWLSKRDPAEVPEVLRCLIPRELWKGFLNAKIFTASLACTRSLD